MTKTAPTFESRLVPQSRECADPNGTVSYEHNSYLEPGEKVLGAHSDIEMTVVKSRYRNPLTRQELVTVENKKNTSTRYLFPVRRKSKIRRHDT